MYDLIILGGGPGGYVAAIRASQLGAKVLLIEKEEVGGVCLNHGCIPTKVLLKNAKEYHEVKNARKYGININGEVTFDYNRMINRKERVIKKFTRGISYLLENNNVEVIKGYGTVTSKTTVQVGDVTYQTKKLILATGSLPVLPNIPGVKEAYVGGTLVTSRELLNIKEVPNNLTIIGGGVIGVEFATIFTLLGSNVTIIEKLPTILPYVDETIRDVYTKELEKLKVKIITNAEVTKVNNKLVTYKLNEEIFEVESDLILMAVGRRANTSAFKALNLNLDGSSVMTNGYLETSIEGVYAIGDVNGKSMLAHTASAEALIAASHALNLATPEIDYKVVPEAIYGLPEIASVGVTEQAAKEQGLKYITSLFPFTANGKALADADEAGFIKLIANKADNKLLGAHIYANGAPELISELVLALRLGLTAEELAQTIHPHPTRSESVLEAALLLTGKALHI